MSLARRTFASLRVPAYRRYFVGHVTSLLGFWMRITAQGWLVYELTGSKAVLGTVTAVGLLPFVVLSPFGGVVADRIDRRRLLLGVPLVAVLANAGLGVLVLLYAYDLPLAYVVAAAVIVGAARAVEIPVRNAFVRDLVGPDDLGNAIALSAAGFNVARVVGPALGAGVLGGLAALGGASHVGLGVCFLTAAGANLAMVVALLGLSAVRSTLAGKGTGPLRQLLEGLRYVRGHRRTRLLLQLLAVTLVSTWSYQTLMPAFARDRLAMQEGGYFLLMAVIGAGALLGALWVAGRSARGRRRRNVVFGLVWTGAVCVLLLGFVADVALALPLLLAGGFCQVGFIATANSMVQESVPDALRGRVMGLWVFTFGSCFPLGSLLMGGVSEALSLTAAWSGGAALMLVVTGILRLRLPPRTPPDEAARPDREGPAPLAAEAEPGVATPLP